MIAYIEEGVVIYKTPKFLILEKKGIGYRINTTSDILSGAKVGDILTLWIYTAVRENAIDLYGFETTEDMEFFELLLEVSGIGPRSALSVLSVAPIDVLKKAIATGDTSYLNKVSGIGKKTADRIVIELRDKLSAYENEEATSSLRGESDIIEALKALGYSQHEAREALKKVAQETEGTNDRIKEALRILNNS